MIRLLQILFLGHAHRWQIIREVPLVWHDDWESPDDVTRSGRRYVLQCEGCGKVKKEDVI